LCIENELTKVKKEGVEECRTGLIVPTGGADIRFMILRLGSAMGEGASRESK